VLSRNLLQHFLDLIDADLAPLDKARDHAYMLNDRLVTAIFRRLFLHRFRFRVLIIRHQIALAIQGAFLDPALLAPIVINTALRGALLAMCRATAKGTTQIVAVCVGRMGEEENPTMTAVLQIAPQVGLAPENRPQSDIVL